MKRFPVLLTVSLLVLAVGVLPAAAATEVGKYHPVSIDSARQYQGSPDGEITLTWDHTIHHPGATFISIHFKDFRLAPGDYLQITDAQGGQVYTLAGRGKKDLGEFWARHVKGDTAVLELYATSRSGGPGFLIDTYSAGFVPIGFGESPGDPDAPVSPLTTCGSSNFENAVCYDGTTEYDRARAVARLLIRGRTLCTGWLVSSDNHLITNAHCIDTSREWDNTDYEFMAEADDCGDANCQMCYPGTVYEYAEMVRLNTAKDYILLQLTSGDPAASYGYLQLDNRAAVVGEQIYLASHPLGNAKVLVIESDVDGPMCKVSSTTAAACTGGTAYYDVGYYCDSEGGSSGSPVLAASSHKVIALHHCGTCPNRGVPITEIYGEIIEFIGDPEPECEYSSDCDDDLFCTGVETCVDEFCVNGSDPCPGQLCNEVEGCHDPAWYCGDGNCDTDEDSCNCPGDCGAPPAEICDNGVSDDCDADVDCDDADCDSDPVCESTCLENGEDCTLSSECCSGWCWRRGGYCR